MRLLLQAQFYPPMIGGEERHVRNLAAHLAKAGHDVHVATLALPPGNAEPLSDAGVTVHQLDSLGRRLPRLYTDPQRPMAPPLPDPVLTRGLYELARRLRPDVTHSHNWIVNSYLPVKSVLRVPLVLSLHDYGHVCATKRLMYQGKPCAGPRIARCLPCVRGHYGNAIGPSTLAAVRTGRPARDRLVDVFTPVSRFVASANGLIDSDGDLRDDTEIVPNFVPDELTPGITGPRPAYLPTEDFFFFAGDLSNQKGLATLLAGYRLLESPKPRLLLAGRPTPDLPDELPDGVDVVRGWPHQRVIEAFRHCSAAVLPSEWPDPCPTTVLEAMSVGAPLITTEQGGIADMVRGEESALVVRPGDPVQLAIAMNRILADPELRPQLVASASEAVAVFRCGRVAGKLERIYRNLIDGQRHAS